MKKLFLLIILFAILLSGCSPAESIPPTATVDIPGTTEALAGTIVAGTLTAMPTNTAPPTETPLPTETLPPTATETETPTSTPTIAATLPPFYGEFAPAGLPAGVDKGLVKVSNETKIKTVSLNIQGTTAQGERPYYYRWTFSESSYVFSLPFGTYNYVIFVGEKLMYSGAFRIYNYDKTTIFIRDGKVVIVGP